MKTPSISVALITGAARRVGAAIARALHAAGMDVILHYRHSATEAHALCAELNALRANSAVMLAADLRQPAAALAAIMDNAVNFYGRLDVLVNNASAFYPTRLTDTFENLETRWDDLMAANLKAPFFLATAAAPWLAKTQGCIINLCDIHGIKPLRNYSIYCISKAGIMMLTRTLAKELAPAVRVNGVAPGEVMWPEGESALADSQKQQVIARIPLGRIGSPENIAGVVQFLALDAGYVTGQVWRVDGGRLMG